jgi:hypothetical protein
MAGKRPTYNLVIGKRKVGALWDAVAKNTGQKYFSGDIDVTALRDAVKEKGTKKKQVSMDKSGRKEDHDTIRVAMFDAVRSQQQSGSSDSADF